MRFLALLLLLPSLARAGLIFDDAWIKNLPPSVPVRAGYLTVTNPDSQGVKIVAVRGEGFTRIEIHRSVMRDGEMHMDQLQELEIGAGQSLRFEPGGLHLMMYPAKPTRPGESYRISIELGDGSIRTIEMTVKK
ncbi:MAG TPA: copper chaperone PCu(A)C [Gammaproteobacteria bacterium]|nr:copper chaperone PCu(A)C [Gammaproteobacteria bacterium]